MSWHYQPIPLTNKFYKIWVDDDEQQDEKPKRRRRRSLKRENRAIDNTDQKAQVETQ